MSEIKIAHFAPFTPRKQGMYETVRELVEAQNRIEGIESAIFDPTRPAGGEKDGGITTANHQWAMDADIYCISSILPSEFWEKKPTLFISHGMPEALLHEEMAYDGVRGFAIKEKQHIINVVGGEGKKTQMQTGRNIEFNKEYPFSTYLTYLKQPFVKGTVTFWPRHLDIWKPFNHNKDVCDLVPQGIDLDRFSPIGEKERLGEKGNITAVYAEMYRYMKNPFFSYLGLARTYEETYNQLRFYGFGCKNGQVPLWSEIINMSGWGEFAPQFYPIRDNIQNIYRGNDFCVSPVPDMSRVAKEALACGMPLMTKTEGFSDYVITDDIYQIADVGRKIVSDILDDRDKLRAEARKVAVDNFDINQTALGMVDIYKRIAGDDKWQR